MAVNFTVVTLASRRDLLPVVAQWIHDEWWQNEPNGLQILTELLQAHREPERIPATFIALVDGIPVGSACLIERDIETEAWPELKPWVAAVYVQPAYRRQGLGATLLNTITVFAARIGQSDLYLTTEGKEEWYQGLGWQVLHEKTEASQLVVMHRRTARRA
jgi:GNAT superfamily N-acetyltransferase